MPATLYSGDTSDAVSASDLESGYVSGHSSQGSSSSPDVFFTNSHLVFLNRQLQNLEPQGTSFLPAQSPGDLSNPVEWQRYYNGASPPFPPYSRPHLLALRGL